MTGKEESNIERDMRLQKKLENQPECVKSFYNSLNTTSTSTTSYIYYVINFINFMKDNYGIEDMKLVTKKHVDQYFTKLKYKKADTKSGKRVTSTSYRATVHTALNEFFQNLLLCGDIDSNIMNKVKRQKITDRPVHFALSPKEVDKVLDNIDRLNGNPFFIARDKLIVLLFLNTGMRNEALTNIKLLDIEKKVINDNLEYESVTVIDKRDKKIKYELDITLTKYIKIWLNQRKDYLKGADCEYLFISTHKNRISTDAVRDVITKYTRNINKNVTPHKMRSTFATTIYDATKDINFVSQALKHEDISTTKRYIPENNDIYKESNKIIKNTFKF